MRYLDDILIMLGLLLVGAYVYLAAAWPGLIGYAGALLIVFGVVLGWRQPARRKS